MTPSQQAALEQVAREWLQKHGEYVVDSDDKVSSLVTLLAAQRAKGLEEANEQDVTAAMREADRWFEKVGGSTRHYVRDCLLPIMKKHGLLIVRAQEHA